jgi:hypothetical protein
MSFLPIRTAAAKLEAHSRAEKDNLRMQIEIEYCGM